LKQFCHLEIKQSNLGANIGVGLFAQSSLNNSTKKQIVFKQDHLIAKYNGEILDNNDYKKRYKGIEPDGPYAIYFNHTHSVDSGCQRGVGSLINHKHKKNANAKFIFLKTGVFVYSKEDIYEGEEIFADYGSSYVFKKNFNTYKKNVIVF